MSTILAIKNSIKSESLKNNSIAGLGFLIKTYLVKTAFETTSTDNKFLYNYVNNLYNNIDKYFDSMTNGIVADEISALIYGIGGTYTVLKSLHWCSKNVIDHVIPNFDSKILPKLEMGCIGALSIIGGGALIANPDIWMSNPVYASGMVSSGLTALIVAGKDVKDKYLNNNNTK